MSRRSSRIRREAPRRLECLVVVLALLAPLVGPFVATSGPPVSAAPPAQRVLLVSDSVGLGAKAALPHAFPAGWDVNVVGTPAMFVEQLEATYVRPRVTAGDLGDHVVIAGGYNYPYWDPARFDRSIDSMVSTLTAGGVDNVYWVTLREVKPQYISAGAWQQVQPYYWYFPTVNRHLEAALQRHPNLTLIDWRAVADQPGLTYDAIHLNPTGAALYSRIIADAVFNAATRPPDGSVTRVKVAEPSGPGAGIDTPAAVAVNLTATGTRTNGYVSAYPCDAPRPTVSNLNHGRDHTVASAAVVPIGASGEICVYNHRAGQVIVDVFGHFDESADLRDAAPRRLIDTRGSPGAPQPAGRTLRVHVVGDLDPAHVSAVALTVTAVGAATNGHVSVHDCARDKPDTSNVNFGALAATPNLVIAAPGADGDLCLTASATTHLVVDRFATFGPTSGIAPITPVRVVDTRHVAGSPHDGQVVRFSLADAGIDTSTAGGAVIANLTIADPQQRGYAAAYPCAAGRPPTSNLNYAPGRNLANLVVVRPDRNDEVCVYVHRAAEVIVDVLGTTGDGFTGIVPERVIDTRN